MKGTRGAMGAGAVRVARGRWRRMAVCALRVDRPTKLTRKREPSHPPTNDIDVFVTISYGIHYIRC